MKAKVYSNSFPWNLLVFRHEFSGSSYIILSGSQGCHGSDSIIKVCGQEPRLFPIEITVLKLKTPTELLLWAWQGLEIPRKPMSPLPPSASWHRWSCCYLPAVSSSCSHKQSSDATGKSQSKPLPSFEALSKWTPGHVPTPVGAHVSSFTSKTQTTKQKPRGDPCRLPGARVQSISFHPGAGGQEP